MPPTLTAPGVYVQEIPSGTRAITGVSTSLTAFVGPTPAGPADEPTKVTSWAEFERRFGGLSPTGPVGHAVQHYFLNGGAEALVVRVVADDAARSSATVPTEVITLAPVAAVAALADYDHLAVSATEPAGGRVDLTVTAVDAEGAPVEVDGQPARITVAAVDVDADDAAADISAATIAGVAPAARLVEAAKHDLLADGPIAADVDAGLVVSGVGLQARDPGAWGDQLEAELSTVDVDPGFAHITIRQTGPDGAVVAEETHLGLDLRSDAATSAGAVLDDRSALVSSGPARPGTLLTAPLTTAPFRDGADGSAPSAAAVAGDAEDGTGLQALRRTDLFNLLCIPRSGWSLDDDADTALWTAAIGLCEERRAFLLVDPPDEWGTPAEAASGALTFGLRSENAALYFPRIRVSDPLQEGRLATFPPCGAVAGAMARTDARRGIWKAPAGTDVGLVGVPELAQPLTDPQQGDLNRLGISCLRSFPVYGRVIWGARTLKGADDAASEWKYVPVRRLALHLEESLARGSRWAVFEPNAEPLWAELRLSIGGFLHQLFRQGAFQGSTPAESYFVKCDRETTLPSDVDKGIVNVLVGFAPAKPAEFVIIKLRQMAAPAGL